MDSTPTRLINIPGEILFFHNSKEELIIVRPVKFFNSYDSNGIVIWNIYSEVTERWTMIEYKDVFENWSHRIQKRNVCVEKIKN